MMLPHGRGLFLGVACNPRLYLVFFILIIKSPTTNVVFGDLLFLHRFLFFFFFLFFPIFRDHELVRNTPPRRFDGFLRNLAEK